MVVRQRNQQPFGILLMVLGKRRHWVGCWYLHGLGQHGAVGVGPFGDYVGHEVG